MSKIKKAWVTRLPRGVQEQQAWLFIGILCVLAGASYLLGFAESTRITEILPTLWLKAWGGFLFLTGILITGSTWASNRALEKLSLRFLSIGLLVYMAWLLAAAPLRLAAGTVFLCLSLVIFAEIRVAVIKTIFRIASSIVIKEECE